MDRSPQSSSLHRTRLGRTDLLVSRLTLSASLADPSGPGSVALAIRALHAALDVGINCIDITCAPQEPAFDQALQSARKQLVLALSLPYTGPTPAHLCSSVESVLQRLHADCIDILHLHASTCTDHDIRRILHDGPLHTLESLREQGKIRFIGLSVDNPGLAGPLLASFRFDILYLLDTFTYQAAADRLLDDAAQLDLGIVAACPLTSAFLEYVGRHLAPSWRKTPDPYEVALPFLLSNSRIHTAAIPMCSPNQIIRNAALAAQASVSRR